MPNPQQPELRRSAKSSTTDDSQEVRTPQATPGAGTHPQGTDKGAKGGGRGGGVPPEQQPDHPV